MEFWAAWLWQVFKAIHLQERSLRKLNLLLLVSLLPQFSPVELLKLQLLWNRLPLISSPSFQLLCTPLRIQTWIVLCCSPLVGRVSKRDHSDYPLPTGLSLQKLLSWVPAILTKLGRGTTTKRGPAIVQARAGSSLLLISQSSLCSCWLCPSNVSLQAPTSSQVVVLSDMFERAFNLWLRCF